jgi:hypothetical protein
VVAPLFAGLTLMGLATLPLKAQRRLGALVLASGMLGWVSLLTDPAFPRRPGADATGPRHVRGRVLPKLRLVGRRAFRGGS